jgi:hypothetical protein
MTINKRQVGIDIVRDDPDITLKAFVTEYEARTGETITKQYAGVLRTNGRNALTAKSGVSAKTKGSRAKKREAEGAEPDQPTQDVEQNVPAKRVRSKKEPTPTVDERIALLDAAEQRGEDPPPDLLSAIIVLRTRYTHAQVTKALETLGRLK